MQVLSIRRQRLILLEWLRHVHKEMMVTHVGCCVTSASHPHVPQAKHDRKRTSDLLTVTRRDDVNNSIGWGGCLRMKRTCEQYRANQ